MSGRRLATPAVLLSTLAALAALAVLAALAWGADAPAAAGAPAHYGLDAAKSTLQFDFTQAGAKTAALSGASRSRWISRPTTSRRAACRSASR